MLWTRPRPFSVRYPTLWTRGAEVESAIKANHHAFKNMHKNYETMETRVMETMEACHENSNQMITMQTQMTKMQNTTQAIADQMSVLTDHITDNPNRSPAKETTTNRRAY
jgi:chromosome segregation ATPase